MMNENLIIWINININLTNPLRLKINDYKEYDVFVKLCPFSQITQQEDSKSYCRLIHAKQIHKTNTSFLSALEAVFILFHNLQIFTQFRSI